MKRDSVRHSLGASRAEQLVGAIQASRCLPGIDKGGQANLRLYGDLVAIQVICQSVPSLAPKSSNDAMHLPKKLLLWC